MAAMKMVGICLKNKLDKNLSTMPVVEVMIYINILTALGNTSIQELRKLGKCIIKVMLRGELGMTILKFPTKKSNLHKITVTLGVCTLEDGFVWWRVEDIKRGEYGEWVKLEDRE